jgi:SAM-dependent methyltransferase
MLTRARGFDPGEGVLEIAPGDGYTRTMTEPVAPPSPLASPEPWNLVADGYVSDIVPLFEKYAEAALDLADLAPTSWVLDVACGPGTLALLAAQRGHRVTAVDFAPSMVEHLRARAAREQLAIEADEGDGQELSYPRAHYEAAFSMFGLIFFPDRVRGLREMLRVLRPGGRAVISSWTPVETVPQLAALFRVIKDLMPGLPFGSGKAPLGTPEDIQEEMSVAGFGDVVVHAITAEQLQASPRAFWESSVRSSAPLVLLRKNLGESAWPAFSDKVLTGLEREFGEGPMALRWTANLGIGTARK